MFSSKLILERLDISELLQISGVLYLLMNQKLNSTLILIRLMFEIMTNL